MALSLATLVLIGARGVSALPLVRSSMIGDFFAESM
jgi:hypothetical protein